MGGGETPWVFVTPTAGCSVWERERERASEVGFTISSLVDSRLEEGGPNLHTCHLIGLLEGLTTKEGFSTLTCESRWNFRNLHQPAQEPRTPGTSLLAHPWNRFPLLSPWPAMARPV